MSGNFLRITMTVTGPVGSRKTSLIEEVQDFLEQKGTVQKVEHRLRYEKETVSWRLTGYVP